MGRRVAFVGLVAATMLAVNARVLASGPGIGWFCSLWASYGCECNQDQGFPPAWSANGSCDFSSEEVPEEVGAAYCEDYWYGCSADCESAYPSYLANYYDSTLPKQDACYRAMTSPNCWVTWADGSCSAGSNSTWGCSCGRFMWCDCDTD
jgi:hypothetical protein